MMIINLLPWRKKRRDWLKKQFIWCLVFVFATALLGVVSLEYYVKQLVAHQMWRNDQLEKEITSLEKQTMEMKTLGVRRETLVLRIMKLQHLKTTGYTLVRFLSELSKIIPNGVYINHMERHNNKISLFGHADSSSHLSQLMRNITDNPSTKEPGIPEIKKTIGTTGSSENEFNLRFFLT